jgi:hypothetical protein
VTDDLPLSRREFDRHVQAHETYHRVRQESLDLALSKAETTLEHRLFSLNEWRAQLADERVQYATKADVRAAVDGCQAEINASRLELREQMWRLMGLSVAVGGAIGGALVGILRGT